MSMVVLMFLYTLAYYQIVSGLPISMTQIGEYLLVSRPLLLPKKADRAF